MKYVFGFLALLLTGCHAPHSAPSGTADTSGTIYWSDGDSGRLNGEKFRLANIDAPETGGVGARGGARCEAERALGFEAKAYMVALTRQADLKITASYGKDRYDRLVIDLSANGQDVARSGLAAGHLADWPHKGRRALQAKPDWCGAQ